MEVISRNVARHTDLRQIGLDDITAHYVPTLAAWRENMARNAAELAAIGYDERFQRLWEMYLAYCEAGFAERRIQDVQLLLAKRGSFRDEPRAAQPSRMPAEHARAERVEQLGRAARRQPRQLEPVARAEHCGVGLDGADGLRRPAGRPTRTASPTCPCDARRSPRSR